MGRSFSIELKNRFTCTCRSRFCLNKASLRILYYGLIYPYLQYCVSVGGSTYHSNLNQLITLQKRTIRIISRSAFDAHTDPLFASYQILKFDNIIKIQSGKIVYLYKNELFPESYNNIFSMNCA